mgnify:CR=1 FL=1
MAPDLAQDSGLVYRPLCDVNALKEATGRFKESDLVSMVSAYYELLAPDLRQSYAPPEHLVQVSMSGYDPHFLFLVSRAGSSAPGRDKVKGLLVFNQESTLTRKPLIDEAACTVAAMRETKVQLQHLSALDETMLEEFIDQGLDFIWRTMHCASIKINLHHYLQNDEKTPGS